MPIGALIGHEARAVGLVHLRIIGCTKGKRIRRILIQPGALERFNVGDLSASALWVTGLPHEEGDGFQR